MALQFNDTTNYEGIVQKYEDEIGAEPGDISGDTTKLKKLVADVNEAFGDFLVLAFMSNGTWQFDDSNHTDYPIITTNLLANQRDYTFLTDEGGNLILDIYKVLVADANGKFVEIKPVDVQSQKDTTGFTDGANLTGTPVRYDKTANGFFLDPIPSYNSTGGLKVYINREASRFTTSDTTKKPGVPGLFHPYFYLKPAARYARINTLANAADLALEVAKMEKNIKDYFSARPRDERGRLSGGKQNNH